MTVKTVGVARKPQAQIWKILFKSFTMPMNFDIISAKDIFTRRDQR